MQNKFGTVYDRYRHFSCPGSDVRIKYALQLQEDGTYDLEEVGKESWHEIIEASYDSCNIDSILQRYKNGDVDVLNQRVGQFGDFTDVPNTPFDIYRKIRNSENDFDHLPIDIKNKFDNSFDRFVSMLGTPSWFEYMGLTNTPNNNVKEESHNNESEQ